MTISARTAFMTTPLGRKEGSSPRGARARSLWRSARPSRSSDGQWPPGLSSNDCRRRICGWEFGPRYSIAAEVTGRGVRRNDSQPVLRPVRRVESEIFSLALEIFFKYRHHERVVFALRKA